MSNQSNFPGITALMADASAELRRVLDFARQQRAEIEAREAEMRRTVQSIKELTTLSADSPLRIILSQSSRLAWLIEQGESQLKAMESDLSDDSTIPPPGVGASASPSNNERRGGADT